jgi:hypothetical protein
MKADGLFAPLPIAASRTVARGFVVFRFIPQLKLRAIVFCPCGTRTGSLRKSNLQHLLEPRQVARAVGRDKMLACTPLSTYIDGDI